MLLICYCSDSFHGKCGWIACTYVDPSGCKNDICGFSSMFRCIMALEYSRFSKFFSFSCKFNVCSVFACNPNDFVFPKLNLHIKHISIGFVILAADDVFTSKLLPAVEPPLSVVTAVLSALSVDGNMRWASFADTTRKECIFGLFCGTGKCAPSAARRTIKRKTCVNAENTSKLCIKEFNVWPKRWHVTIETRIYW